MLIDFLQTNVMKRNFPAFGVATGVDCLCGDPGFTIGFGEHLTQTGADPCELELITIAFCAGHSFAITNAIPEGESENIEYFNPTKGHVPDLALFAMARTSTVTRASCGMAS